MSTYKLDFSLTTDEQRCQLIASFCSTSTYTSKQYTQMADYILLAPTSTGIHNPILPIEFSSPKKQPVVESLDSLLEDPITENLVENSGQPVTASLSIYKKTMRKIDRTQHATIPGMLELWKSIDKLREEKGENWKQCRSLILLYKKQYELLEAFLPQTYTLTHYPKPHKSFYNWSAGIPLENGETAYLDLSNPKHMAEFLIELPSLVDYCDNNPNCELYDLIEEVYAAIDAANLSSFQQAVLYTYHMGFSGTTALSYIKETLNRTINQPYLSNVLHRQIATKVSFEFAEIHNSKLYADDPSKWRTCLRCHQPKLLTKHNWLHYSNKPQGFDIICKECRHAEKEARKEKSCQ